jgi:hypothetical protein
MCCACRSRDGVVAGLTISCCTGELICVVFTLDSSDAFSKLASNDGVALALFCNAEASNVATTTETGLKNFFPNVGIKNLP